MTSLRRFDLRQRFELRAATGFGRILWCILLLLVTAASASAQTPPGPTTVNCPYATTNPNTCWVSGDFTATITPAASTHDGASLLHYRFCRSLDESSDDFTGCAETIRFDAATSQSVSGADLPGTGNRRSYWFRAIYSDGHAGPWNTPRYVRLDAFDPVVAATGSSTNWQASAQATVTARDITGNAAANSGIDAVRFSWNTPLDAACTQGSATAHGAVLNAPEGDNTLYLCTRDRVGRVDTWSGTYRVESALPSPPGPTTIACPHATTSPDTCWVSGDFTATITPAEPTYAGANLLHYRFCRSNDASGDGPTGCVQTIRFDAATSQIVSGADLPGNGNRRSYWFRAIYSNGYAGPWNTPRYVRLDAFDPVVAATGSSTNWQTSAQATVTARDITGNAAANSGIHQVRYSWNSPLNANCSNGALTSHGAVLDAPEGDNTLYLCTRDRVGRVDTWSGPFRVDSSSPTPPGPTTISCAYTTTNPNTCWVTGDFVATVTPAGDGAGGSNIASYDFCRSGDYPGDDFSGCEQTISVNAGTSHTVSGSHLPGDGMRRSYWFRAIYHDGTEGDWNVPRYVRIDRHDPRVSATNASPQWFTSRSLTLAADDAGGPGAAVNTGLVEARYSWNVPTNAACTNGTVYNHGDTLNVPEGDNTLYLCGRDVTGRVGTWNNTYRVDTSIPVLDSLTVSSSAWSIGDGTTYQITAQTTDVGAGVRELWVTINRDGDNSANPRGQFSWRDETMGYLWPADQVPCQGGGFASKRPDLFGPEHTTLVGCVTSVSGGGQRTVTFTVRPEASFGVFAENDISLFSRDFLVQRTPWQNYDLNFASVELGDPILMVLDNGNALSQNEEVPWGTVEQGSGDISRELVVKNNADVGSSPLVLERPGVASNIALVGSSAFSTIDSLESPIAPQDEFRFSVVLDTSQAGTHNADFLIWHNDPPRPNPLTIRLTATVENTTPPIIDTVSPWKITPGGVRTVTLNGQNFEDATVMIPTAPFDNDQPPRVFPTVTSYSVNAAGTQITANIDTSAAGVDGVYNLLVQTPCQDCVDGIDLRVAPANTPVVDMYTPSEVGVGRVFPIILTGANLQNSTLTATHPGVQVLNVDSTDDEMISGALSIPDSIDPEDFDIEIFTPGQGLTTVPVSFLLEGEPGTKSNHAVVSEEKIAAARAAGTEMPGIYIQEPTLSPSLQARLTSGEASAEKVTSCIFTFNRRLISLTRVLVIPLDEFGNIDHNVLQAVGLGEVVRFGAITISLFADVTFQFNFDACAFSDFGVCIIGRLGFEVIGLDGIVVNFSFCLPLGGGSSATPTDGGSLTRVEFTSAGNCNDVNQTTSPLGGGSSFATGSVGAHYADFTRNGCCPETVRVDLTVSTFTDQGALFAFVDRIGTTDFPESENPCPPCTVTIASPPKCILASDTVQLTANPSIPGGTFVWSMPQGPPAATFDGSHTESTVDVRGIAASFAVNDVVVRVDYSAPTGVSCHTEEELTVIEFEPFEFRAGETEELSFENDRRGDDDAYNLPALGAQRVEDIVGSGTFTTITESKNMEIGIAVLPCSADLDCDFNINRELQGRAFEEVDGNINNGNLNCPAPAWCPDDPDNIDEDLTVHPQTCSIYVYDTPAIGHVEPCRNDFHRIVSCLNFREWVEFNGGESEKFPWHAATQMECSDPHWVRSGLNVIGTEHIGCNFPPGNNLFSPQGFDLPEGLEILEVAERLSSEDQGIRRSANDWLLQQIPALSNQDRKELSDLLIQILKGQLHGTQMDSPSLLATRLLGELGGADAVVHLIERVDQDFPRFILGPSDAISPAARALIQIGDASVDAILHRANAVTESEWETLLYVLDKLDPKVVEMKVYSRLTKDDGSLGQARLQALLTD